MRSMSLDVGTRTIGVAASDLMALFHGAIGQPLPLRMHMWWV